MTFLGSHSREWQGWVGARTPALLMAGGGRSGLRACSVPYYQWATKPSWESPPVIKREQVWGLGGWLQISDNCQEETEYNLFLGLQGIEWGLLGTSYIEADFCWGWENFLEKQPICSGLNGGLHPNPWKQWMWPYLERVLADKIMDLEIDYPGGP